MSDRYQESELKLYVPDLDSARERIEAAGGHLAAPRVFERNVRYEDSAGEIKRFDRVLRLRQDTRVRLTLKESPDRNSGGFSQRFEAEVEVSDFETMELILSKMGFFPALTYEKYRTTYELDGVEIVLDEMPYGNFVELEGDETSIYRVVEKVGLGDARQFGAGYMTLFDRVRRALGMKIWDLTFANFEGVIVPESAFEA